MGGMVLVVDEHPLIGESVAAIVHALAPDAIVERRSSLRGCAQTAARGRDVALVVADLALRDAHGIRTLENLRAWWPGAQIVVFSGARNALLHTQCLAAGASAVVLKTAPTSELRLALQRALGAAAARLAGSVCAPPAASGARKLPPMQAAIWVDLAKGLSNPEIARRHGISVNTVKTHVREVYERIGARNRTEAARLFLQRDGYDRRAA